MHVFKLLILNLFKLTNSSLLYFYVTYLQRNLYLNQYLDQPFYCYSKKYALFM